MIKYQQVDFSNFEEKIKKLGQALEKYAPDLVTAYLFGSGHEGKTTPLSDIDLAFLLADDLQDAQIETKILLDAIKILGTEEIDSLNLNQAPLRFQYSVIKNKRVVFCSNPEKRINFETRVIMNYLDFAPVRSLFNREFLKRLGVGG
ncbi:MAG: nucleotidyltransferase domain-containing protein [Clostridia bacterium]|nr:nucleotidyltransferase domain-containing protein [Clostridia bacterium]MDD4145900.1 nucleotidyltransferase domain-containing protein [Clostridia bacterium]MDD4665582.1 nucleotidyltransferase domain-containing protein [Clostridia bacterium]